MQNLIGLKVVALSRVLITLAIVGASDTAFAWIYPEHRDIAILAVEGLDPERKAAFERFWEKARIGDEQRLCAQGADTEQKLAPPCIDWAALSAVAGDHSCSSQEMLETVRLEDWILVVADVAAQLKLDLSRIPVTAAQEVTAVEVKSERAVSGAHKSPVLQGARQRLAGERHRAARLNALRTADTRLQRADPQYASRADSNLAHFVMPRPDTNLDPYAWGQLALKPGSPINAAGVYMWFHLSAMNKAGRLAHERLTPDERRVLARSMLFDEAFALHFLEDIFAAGHVAGSWGDVSQRKGTHDFYNQNGLEVFTWKGRDKTIVLMGDAHMRPQDAELAANAVRTSLAQVLDAANGRSPLPHKPSAHLETNAFDICKNVTFPADERSIAADEATRRGRRAAMEAALLPTPVPGLGPGLGAVPRSRSEVGAFAGVAGAIDGRGISNGFAPSQNSKGFIGGLDFGFRTGVGLEGALGEAGDGLVFGQIGLRADSRSSNKATGTALESLGGSLSAAIPARTGLSTRVRMPFYLLPGDLLFLSPMYFFDRDRYSDMAVTAANGGLIPWQQGLSTSVGRFQFVLGRELGATWYGLFSDDQVAAPSSPPGGPGRVVNFKSVALDVPILEYRPYRSFGSKQSSTILFQLFGGVDIPYGETVDSPAGAPSVSLRPVYSAGLRMVFDWRYYY